MDAQATPTRTVVITGGSSGIGRAAIHFARKGWNVGLIARGEAGLNAGRADVEAAGRRVATAVTDVTNSEALEQAAAKIETELGPIEVWIHGAGVSFYGKFAQPAISKQRTAILCGAALAAAAFLLPRQL